MVGTPAEGNAGNRRKPRQGHREGARGESGVARFAAAYEFLVSQGHDEGRLWDYSPEKLDLLYRLALKRVTRQAAVEDLRQLRIVRLAIASIMDKKGASAAQRVEQQLMAEAAGQQVDQTTKALRILAAHVKE
jgi:hypothetical protein